MKWTFACCCLMFLPFYLFDDSDIAGYSFITSQFGELCVPIGDREASDCRSHEAKVWKIFLDQSFSDLSKAIHSTDADCQKKLANDSKSLAASVSSKGECWTDSNLFLYKTLTQSPGFNSIVLSCCIIQPPSNTSEIQINNANLSLECVPLQSRSLSCNKLKWVLLNDSGTTSSFETESRPNSSPSQCLEWCNNDAACLLFEYNSIRQLCIFKYHFNTLITKSQTTLYSLYCCDRDFNIVSEQSKCRRESICNFGETRAWQKFGQKSFASNKSITNFPQICRFKCFSEGNCSAVATNADGSCRLKRGKIDIEKDLTDSKNSHVFVLSCCFLEGPGMVSNEIQSAAANCSKFTDVTSRNDFCLYPKWTLKNERAKLKYFGAIKNISAVSVNQCLNKCNEFELCLGFEYDNILQECILKHQHSVDIDKSADQAITGKLVCCETNNKIEENQLCQLPENENCKKGQNLRTVIEKHVVCQKKVDQQLLQISVHSFDKCQQLCNMFVNCQSMEIRIGDNFNSRENAQCILTKTVDVCVVVKENKSIRVYKACCQSMNWVNVIGKPLNSVCDDLTDEEIYNGNLDKSQSYKACLNWNDVRDDIPAVAFPENNSQHNYCRNLNGKWPFCIVSGSYLFERCNVSACRNVFPMASANDLCYPVRHSRNVCKLQGYSFKWTNDSNVTCFSTEVFNKLTLSHKECQLFCQDSRKCLSFEVHTLKRDKNLCYFKKTIDICAPTSLEKGIDRYTIGCCAPMRNYNQNKQRDSTLKECFASDKFSKITFTGNLSITRSNKACQSWKLTGRVLSKMKFPDGSNEHNYCRNVNDDPSGPWCITTGNFFEYCGNLYCAPLYKQPTDTACKKINNKATDSCSTKGHERKWSTEEDSCTSHATNTIQTMQAATIDTCALTCEVDSTCVSFELKKDDSTNSHECTFKSKIERCAKKGFKQYSLECCVKPSHFNTDDYIRSDEGEFLGIKLTYWYFLGPIVAIAVVALIAAVISFVWCKLRKPRIILQSQVDAHANSETVTLKTCEAVIMDLK